MTQFKQLNDRFVLFTPEPDDVAEAFGRSQALGVTAGSFTRGNGRMTGFLGEVAFGKYLTEAAYVGGQSYTHDYELAGKNIDIKSKSCGGQPKLDYAASVNSRPNKPLAADIYFFTRVHSSLSKVWLLGWTTRYHVEKEEHFKKKGTTEADGFKYLSDGYHLPIRRLRRPDSLRDCLSVS